MDDYEAIEHKTKKRKLVILFSIVAVACLVIVLVFQSGQFQLSNVEEQSSSVEEEACDTDTFVRKVIGEGYECNDGTEAVYYIDLASPDSPNYDKWFIELPGGGTCATVDDCDSRWENREADMTTDTRETRTFGEEGGLDSFSAEYNPYFYNYNRVVGHYCTSDSWLGQSEVEDNDSRWSFLGAKNAFAMIEQLGQTHENFRQASTFIMSGVSVGGTGILNLADGMDETLGAISPDSQRYFISDCGWDIYGWKYEECEWRDCTTEELIAAEEAAEEDAHSFTPGGAVVGAVDKKEYWNANCAADGYTWECAYAEWLYPYINVKDNIMVANQLYDFQQLSFCTSSYLAEQWSTAELEFAMSRSEAMLETFEDVGVANVFASNCRSHDFTEHDAVYTTEIDGHGFAYYANQYVTTGESFRKVDALYPESNPTCDFTFFENDPREDAC